MPFHHSIRFLLSLAVATFAACERADDVDTIAVPPAPSASESRADGVPPSSAESASPAKSDPEPKPEPEPEPEPEVALGYTFRDGKVWHLATAKDYYGKRLEPQMVEGADPATFQALPVAGGGTQAFGKDSGGAYYQHRKIEGADTATFGPLGAGHPLLAIDARRVFFKDAVLCEGAANFQFVGTEFATNGQSVYYVASGEVASQDVSNFRLLRQEDGSEWHADSKSVWCDGVQIVGADPATFRVLGKHYAVDAKRAYFWSEIIPDADPATFEVMGPARKDDPLGAPLARDAKRVFHGTFPSPRVD
jgi:hypothetical protein